jgi:hypothetical protein
MNPNTDYLLSFHWSTKFYVFDYSEPDFEPVEFLSTGPAGPNTKLNLREIGPFKLLCKN